MTVRNRPDRRGQRQIACDLASIPDIMQRAIDSRGASLAVVGAATLLLLSNIAFAQVRSDTKPSEWQVDHRLLWHVDAGYPTRLSGGATLVIGRSRRLSGYESTLTGVLIGGDIGLVSAQVRAGWGWLRPYDAGISGYSIEAVVVRPIGFDSVFHQGTSYLGLQPSFYFGLPFRVSGAALIPIGGGSHRIVPSATVALVSGW